MKRDLRPSTVGGRGALPEELLESVKSSRVMQSVQLDLGRPVPCEQGAADIWAIACSADLRIRCYVLLCFCVWAYTIVGL